MSILLVLALATSPVKLSEWNTAKIIVEHNRRNQVYVPPRANDLAWNTPDSEQCAKMMKRLKRAAWWSDYGKALNATIANTYTMDVQSSSTINGEVYQSSATGSYYNSSGAFSDYNNARQHVTIGLRQKAALLENQYNCQLPKALN